MLQFIFKSSCRENLKFSGKFSEHISIFVCAGEESETYELKDSLCADSSAMTELQLIMLKAIYKIFILGEKRKRKSKVITFRGTWSLEFLFLLINLK